MRDAAKGETKSADREAAEWIPECNAAHTPDADVDKLGDKL